jgi:hypothetical protein
VTTASGHTIVGTYNATIDDMAWTIDGSVYGAVDVNTAPTIVGSITDASYNIGDTKTLDNVAQYFNDSDGDTLSYTAQIDDGTVMTLDEWLSTPIPESATLGAHTITVTATDPSGASATQTFTVTVNAAVAVNTAPVASTTIPDQSYTVGDTITADPADYFTDADGDTLTYTVKFADGTTQSWTDFVSNPLPADFEGTQSLTLIATDPSSASVEQTFSIVVAAAPVVNTAPTGSVTITGDATSGQTLTAINNLVDVDGLGTITYTWTDGTNTLGTDATYTLTDAQVSKTISVTASYTDGGNTVESVASTATAAVAAAPITLIQIKDAEMVTWAQASIDEYGSDVTDGSTNTIMKFDLYLSAEGLAEFTTTTGVSAITINGASFDIDWSATELQALDWTGIDNELTPTVQTYEDGSTAPSFIGMDNVTSITYNGAEGSFAFGGSTAIVDTDPSNDGLAIFGGINSEVYIDTFYVNPKDGIEQVSLSIKDIVLSTDQGDVSAADYSVMADTNMVDAMIQLDDASGYLNNTTIHYYKDGVDTGISTLIEEGGIIINDSVVFDEIKLANNDAYNSGISIGDAVDVYKYLVNLAPLTEGSAEYHAADVNNDGSVTIGDAVSIEKHIVNLAPIDSFDLIDAQGNRITSLDADSSVDMQTWTIVANGDVDLSGSFNEAYVIGSDLV